MWQEQQKLQTSHQESVAQCSHTVYVLLYSELSKRLFLPLISVVPHSQHSNKSSIVSQFVSRAMASLAYYVRDATGNVPLPPLASTSFSQGKLFDPLPHIYLLCLFSGVQLLNDCAAN